MRCLVRYWHVPARLCYAFPVRWPALIPLAFFTALQAQEIPSRSLLPELAAAEQGGLAASVHTQYALANGLFVARGVVLAARHSVMKPGNGALAEEIGVGYTRPPLDNVTESRSVTVAEDPAHDLVLLRLLNEPDTPAEKPVKSAPCKAGRAHKAQARPKGKSRPVRVARFVRIGAPVKLQVIQDGPQGKQKTRA